jgi:energy-coupling factor transporter ATP-binding protein EcfA2
MTQGDSPYLIRTYAQRPQDQDEKRSSFVSPWFQSHDVVSVIVAEPQYPAVLNDEATLQDDLGRARYVQILKEVLLEADTPLVVALYGPWGSGKTSMMKQLQRELDPPDGTSARLAATVWFVPWEHSGDPQPAVSLLHAIRRDLGLQKDRTVRHALTAIAMAVTEEARIPYLGLSLGRVQANYLRLAKQDVERKAQQALLRERFSEVIRAARRNYGSMRLVVFIDDLDRCQPATAVSVLEALKLYLNYPGCVFVLGVDRQPIEAAIAVKYKNLEIAKENYLDKIVQLPFTIPALTTESVERYILEKVPKRLQDCRGLLAVAAPDNPRQLKRTINLLFLLDRIAAGSIPNYDARIMCALALTQNSAPDLYQLLRYNPKAWATLVPVKPDSPEASALPAELAKKLEGTDARRGLAAALKALSRLLTLDSVENVNIGPYVTLSENLAQVSASAVDGVRSDEDITISEKGKVGLQGGSYVRERASVGETEESDLLARNIAVQQKVVDEVGATGKDIGQRLKALSNLAGAYTAADMPRKALDIQRGVVELSTETLGRDAPESIEALSKVAVLQAEVGDVAGAMSTQQEVVKASSRVLGPEHPDTLAARASLARWTGNAGDPAGARDQYAAVVPIYENVLGREHAATTRARASLARWTGNAGDPAGARDQYAALLPLQQRLSGPEHPDTLAIRGNLAYWTGQAGDPAAARDQYAKLVPVVEQVLGLEHPETQNIRHNLARWTERAGELTGRPA